MQWTTEQCGLQSHCTLHVINWHSIVFVEGWRLNLRPSSATRLSRLINQASKICGSRQTPLSDLYHCAVIRKATMITADSSHPLHQSFQRLPSGRRYKVPLARKNRKPFICCNHPEHLEIEHPIFQHARFFLLIYNYSFLSWNVSNKFVNVFVSFVKDEFLSPTVKFSLFYSPLCEETLSFTLATNLRFHSFPSSQMSSKRSSSFRRAIANGRRTLQREILLDETGLGLYKRFVRYVAYEILPCETDRRWYFHQNRLCPPPVFIAIVTIVQVSVGCFGSSKNPRSALDLLFNPLHHNLPSPPKPLRAPRTAPRARLAQLQSHWKDFLALISSFYCELYMRW